MRHPQGRAHPPQHCSCFRGLGKKGMCSKCLSCFPRLFCHWSVTSSRLHTTPASSSWEQLCVPTPAWEHSSSVLSCPEHCTSSRRMRRDVPAPNSAFLVARSTKGKPSWRHTTAAAGRLQPSSHTVPHSPSMNTSTLPRPRPSRPCRISRTEPLPGGFFFFFFFLLCPRSSVPLAGFGALPPGAAVGAWPTLPAVRGVCGSGAPPHGASAVLFRRGCGVGVFIINSVGGKDRKPWGWHSLGNAWRQLHETGADFLWAYILCVIEE